MTEQNNEPKFLEMLWIDNLISPNDFFFRKKAYELGIKTYVNERTEQLIKFINNQN